MTHSTNLNRQYTQDVNTSQAYPVLVGSYESTTTQLPSVSRTLSSDPVLRGGLLKSAVFKHSPPKVHHITPLYTTEISNSKAKRPPKRNPQGLEATHDPERHAVRTAIALFRIKYRRTHSRVVPTQLCQDSTEFGGFLEKTSERCPGRKLETCK
jgi:hypothetical protein